jgi:signal transduction histidine kinase
VLRQAVLNLVDNAVKHGPRDSSIVVRASVEGAHAVLAVTDQGPGIAPEHRERIFDRFWRAGKARSREDGGAGLGLAIARWTVESHGGRIELDSEIGKGSTFRIVLPRAATATADERIDAQRSEP